MSGTGIAPYISEAQAEAYIADNASAIGEYSPLRAVTLHVAARAIGAAIALDGIGSDLVYGAEKWLVQKYVGEDFCGLCGRSTDHRGEH